MAKWPLRSWQAKSRPTFTWFMGVFWGCERWPAGGSCFQQMIWVMEVCHLLCIIQAAERFCSPSHDPIRTLHLSHPNLVHTYLQPAEPRLARSTRNFWDPILICGLCKLPCVPKALWKDDVLHSAPRIPSKSLHLHRAIQTPLYQKHVLSGGNQKHFPLPGSEYPSCKHLRQSRDSKASTIPH